MFKLIAVPLLALFVSGCATTDSGSSSYGSFIDETTLGDQQQIADDAVRKLLTLYPPANTKFELQQATPDAFGSALVKSLRKRGYALLELNSNNQKKASAKPVNHEASLPSSVEPRSLAKVNSVDNLGIKIIQTVAKDRLSYPLRYELNKIYGEVGLYRLLLLVGNESTTGENSDLIESISAKQQQIIDSAVKQLSAQYPPYTVRFELQQTITDDFGADLIETLREHDYALSTFAPSEIAQKASFQEIQSDDDLQAGEAHINEAHIDNDTAQTLLDHDIAADSVTTDKPLAEGFSAFTDFEHNSNQHLTAIPLRYVLDQADENLYRLLLLIGNQSIHRPYFEQNGSFVPAGYWVRKD